MCDHNVIFISKNFIKTVAPTISLDQTFLIDSLLYTKKILIVYFVSCRYFGHLTDILFLSKLWIYDNEVTDYKLSSYIVLFWVILWFEMTFLVINLRGT